MQNIEIGDYVKLHKWTHGISTYRYDDVFIVMNIVNDGNLGYYLEDHYAVLNKNCTFFDKNDDLLKCVRLSNLVLYEKGRFKKIKNIINRINDK